MKGGPEMSASVRSKFDWLAIIKVVLLYGGIIGGLYYASSGRLEGWYKTEKQAQAHCPSDVVVWLNTSSKIYHYKWQRWYGATHNGTYMCKQEAEAAGDRASLNGQ
jgi:hypothetical protein